MQSREQTVDKTLVVFYSYTGTSRRLAQLLAGMLGCPTGEIFDARPRAGALGSLRCALESMVRAKPAIRYDGPAPDGYGTVVLISPIWIYRLASPMRSFVDEHQDALRNVAVVSVMGGKGAPNAVAEIGRLLGRAPVLTTAFTTREVEDGSCAQRLQAFGDAVSAMQRGEAVVRPAVWSERSA